MKVLITKGTHKGKIATVTGSKKEEIGNGRLYTLKDEDGAKIWNDSFSNFPEAFIKPINN